MLYIVAVPMKRCLRGRSTRGETDFCGSVQATRTSPVVHARPDATVITVKGISLSFTLVSP
jgi:hypothetical protein